MNRITVFVAFLLSTLLVFVPSLVLAECSNYRGQATINEAYTGTGNDSPFIEVKIIDEQGIGDAWKNWSLSVCSGKAKVGCAVFDLPNSSSDDPWFVTDLPKNSLDFSHGLDIVLKDGGDNAIDYLSVQNFDDQKTNCSFNYDTNYPDKDSSFNLSRIPDGTGTWTVGSPGNSGDHTRGANNDGSTLPDIDHIRIEHDGYGINCKPENITITVINSDGTIASNYAGSVTLTTDSDNGTWLPGSGNGNLVDTTDDDGIATYTFATSDNGVVVLQLFDEHDERVNIAVSDGTITDDDTEGLLDFNPVGFEVSPNPVGTQISCQPFPLTFTAVGQTIDHPECGVITEYSGDKKLKFWFNYINPTDGGVSPKINDQLIAVSAPTSEQTITFDTGVATVVAQYSDAGKIQIFARDDVGVGDPVSGVANEIVGGLGPFVVKPDHFNLAATKNDGAPLNNTTSGGTPTEVAGNDFSITAQAVCADNTTVTHNYIPDNAEIWIERTGPTTNGSEGILKFRNLTTPKSYISSLGTIPGWANISSSFVSGMIADPFVAYATTTYSEVGLIKLHLRDNDYIGKTISENTIDIGRFTPDHFEIESILSGILKNACNNFTYTGQTIEGYVTGGAPEFTIRAMNALTSSQTTQNYTGDFAKLETADIDLVDPIDKADADQLGADETNKVLVDTWLETGTLADNGDGTLTYTASSNDEYMYLRDNNALVSPFESRILLQLKGVEEGNVPVAYRVVAVGLPLDVEVGGTEIRYGRINLENAYGSELLDLNVPMKAEYFDQGSFRKNIDDTCTEITPPLVISNIQPVPDSDLSASDICVFDTGNPGNSGIGCEILSEPTKQFSSPPDIGEFNLWFAAPGAGKTGSFMIEADVPDFLKYDWEGNGDENPTARATFGIFKGNEHIIYLRETTWR